MASIYVCMCACLTHMFIYIDDHICGCKIRQMTLMWPIGLAVSAAIHLDLTTLVLA